MNMSEVVFYGPLNNPRSGANKHSKLPIEAYRIAVDGGSNTSVSFDLWCGDGDSGQPPAGVPSMIKESQDQTDLEFALQNGTPKNWNRLHLIGFLGGRRDHELAVIGDLYRMFLGTDSKTAVIYEDESTVFARLLGPGNHTLILEGMFSILAVETTQLTLLGACRYQAKNITLLPLSGRGVSNIGEGTVEISCSHSVFVFESLSRS